MRRHERGFTLVELMVAGLIAASIIAAVYMTYTRSVRSYRVQQDLMSTYSRLRFGIGQLKMDIRKAGYNATLNSTVDPFVRPPLPTAQPLRMIQVIPSLPDAVPLSDNEKVSPTALLLFGDYFSPVVFPAPGDPGVPTGVVYPVEQISGSTFKLDVLGVGTLTPDELQAVFRPGARLLHVEHRSEGTHYYFPVVSVNAPDRTITVGAVVPSALVNGIYKNVYVNPVGYVRYRIVSDTRPLGPSDPDTGNPTAPVGKTDLVREEVAWDDVTGDPIPGTRLVIAEYAVDLQFYDFVFDDAMAGQPPALSVLPNVTDVVNGAGNGLLGAGVLARPEDLRFLTVKLSVRTSDEDPDVPFVPRTGEHAPLRRYEVDPDLTGSSRVESMATRVQLVNASFRNLK